MRKKLLAPIHKPSLYPWGRPSRDVFVSGNTVAPFNGRVTQVSHRFPVVAIGENACIDVMIAKFNERLDGLHIPWVCVNATVRNLAAGFAPFVTANGYVPITPFTKIDAVTKVWVSFFDQAHLDALDSTMLGFTRTKLSGDNYLLTLDRDGQKIDEFFIYQADKGYMTDGLSPLVAPMTQKQVFGYLQGIDNIAPLLPDKYGHSYMIAGYKKISDRIAKNDWMYRGPNLEGKVSE